MRRPTAISASPTHSSVCNPSITSTSFISGTGLKKWKPAKRCGVLSFEAMVVTESEDVLVASMQSGATTASSSAKSFCFASRFSTMASITTWQDFMSIGPPTILMRSTAPAASSFVIAPFSAARANIFSMNPRASSAAPGRLSLISTCMLPAAATWAMPRPIAPVPITPIVRSRRFASNGMAFFRGRHVIRRHGAHAPPPASAAFELGLALLHEGGLPFPIVLTRETGVHHALAEVEIALRGVLQQLDERALHRSDGERSVAGNGARKILDEAVELSARHHSVNQAHLQRLLRGELPASKEDLGGIRRADDR